ncbi:Altered inheritance of mitochondria protein 1 [Colletotrichum chlorophyti]|uniref:Altered inheritance of mitochondria protein 1 n=1 Tax=Colletotrichum chlorophyti TaxID=708187 RepID=A0A1Q8RAS9_9PEZI|nr:Altered inheritance of mitochondria protein 1 [Colletotrichum chlorophyti]
MLCRSCRRAVALSNGTPSNFLARASIRNLPIATRYYSSQSAFSARIIASSSSPFAPQSSPQVPPKRFYSAAPENASPLEKPDHLDAAESTIWDKLVAEFAPSELIVQDVSGGCGSMYAIDITSAKFKGANMLKQQRMVNAVLGDMMKQWHGVQLRTKAP